MLLISIMKRIFSKVLLTLAVGAFLSAVSQVAYERFFSKISIRFGLMIFVIATYSWLLSNYLPASTLSMEIRSEQQLPYLLYYLHLFGCRLLKARLVLIKVL